jgi:DNA polymerase-3 subunit epsilon
MAAVEHHPAAVDLYLQTPPPAPSVPWREASFAVLGLEVTGSDPDRDQILSLACVPVRRGRAIIGQSSETTVDPEQMHPALDAILEALTGRVLVAHAAAVHVGFLSVALRSAGLELMGPALDTSVLAAWVPPRAGSKAQWPLAMGASPGLAWAASSMGLPIHRPHQASGEALTAAQLFMALASHLDRAHPQTVGSLARLSSESRPMTLDEGVPLAQTADLSARIASDPEQSRPIENGP